MLRRLSYNQSIMPQPSRIATAAIIVWLVAVISAPAMAKKMYQYQDHEGRWTFSDKPPPSDAETVENLQIRQLKLSRRERKVNLVKRGSEQRPEYFVINQYHGPIELQLALHLSASDNVTATPPLPHRMLVPAASELRATTLFKADAGRDWSYAVQVKMMIGDPAAKHRPQHPYRVPFGTGQYVITQGFGGRFSHFSAESEYAVDIAMPEGTPVLAARAGKVMDVADDFFTGGTSAHRYIDRANTVRILHDDGTMAVYAHLQLESASALPGMSVRAGQPIARSGNTGFSGGPHLHFVIQRNAGLKLVSLPFEFETPSGAGTIPKVGMTLTATPPDQRQR